MAELSVDELSAAAVKDETLASVLERRLDDLAPRLAPWNRRAGAELPNAADYAADDLGRARYRREFAARRRVYLEARYATHSARATRHAEAARAATLGLDRFLPAGRFGLDDLVAPTVEARKAAGTRLESDTAARRRRELWGPWR